MEPSGHKKVKAAKVKYQPLEDDHYQVDQGVVVVEMGGILDIEIECPKGFSVFVPFPGIFQAEAGSDQVFNAVQAPDRDDLWSVSMQRLNKPNPNSEKEFAYCIYVKEHDDFAVAASPPKMNINP